MAGLKGIASFIVITATVFVALRGLHLAVPIVFGTVGAAFGYAAVFFSNSALLAAGGLLLRKAGIPGSKPRD